MKITKLTQMAFTSANVSPNDTAAALFPGSLTEVGIATIASGASTGSVTFTAPFKGNSTATLYIEGIVPNYDAGRIFIKNLATTGVDFYMGKATANNSGRLYYRVTEDDPTPVA